MKSFAAKLRGVLERYLGTDLKVLSMADTTNTAPAQAVPTNAAKLLDYIAVTTSAMQKAAEAEKKQRETNDAVSALIPQVCDTMVSLERCRPDERAKLAASLTDPVAALKLLIDVAGHRNKAEMAVLGKAAGDRNKQAGDAGSTEPYRGYAGERTTRIKESDHAWFRGLGVQLSGAGQ